MVAFCLLGYIKDHSEERDTKHINVDHHTPATVVHATVPSIFVDEALAWLLPLTSWRENVS